jgi:hypothetical protein
VALVNLARALGVSRAVAFAVFARGWQLLTGPITILLVTSQLTENEQGFFYMFGSLLNLQNLFELGLTLVFLNLSSHAFAGCRFVRSEATGTWEWQGKKEDQSRVASLFRQGLWCSAIQAMLFLAVVMPLGIWFFATRPESATTSWVIPWVVVVVCAAISQVEAIPMTFLEGAGEVLSVQRMRFFMAVAGTSVMWMTLGLRLGVWCAAAVAVTRVVVETGYLLFIQRAILNAVLTRTVTVKFDWWGAAWPLQLRAGLQGLLITCSTAPMIPVVFAYQGAAMAGRLGLVFAVVTAIQTAAGAWLQTRVPALTTLAAQRHYTAFRELFARSYRQSNVFLLCAMASFVGMLALIPLVADPVEVVRPWTVGWLAQKLEPRLLPILPATLLAFALVVHHQYAANFMFVRAHLYDPFLKASLVTHPLAGWLIWAWGREYGATGAILGYLLPMLLILWPWTSALKRQCIQKIHATERSEENRVSSPVP